MWIVEFTFFLNPGGLQARGTLPMPVPHAQKKSVQINQRTAIDFHLTTLFIERQAVFISFSSTCIFVC